MALSLNHLQFSSQESVQEEDEDALSLCDLPLNDISFKQSRSSSLSESSEFFQFSNDVVPDMCPADEIFFSGTLVPAFIKHESQKNQTNITKPLNESNNPPNRLLRSDPIAEPLSPVSRSNSVGTPRCSVMIRNSRCRSLDLRKLHRSSISDLFLAPETDRRAKPRWYSLMFGTVKVPPEMELRDIKIRQIRRNLSTTMFPADTDAGVKVAAVNRRSGKVSWRILKALSCKDQRSVSVTTSLAVQ